jgi:hypothetical protein
VEYDLYRHPVAKKGALDKTPLDVQRGQQATCPEAREQINATEQIEDGEEKAHAHHGGDDE